MHDNSATCVSGIRAVKERCYMKNWMWHTSLNLEPADVGFRTLKLIPVHTGTMMTKLLGNSKSLTPLMWIRHESPFSMAFGKECFLCEESLAGTSSSNVAGERPSWNHIWSCSHLERNGLAVACSCVEAL